MTRDRWNDLRAFLRFAETRLLHGEADPTLDEALILWDIENAPEDEKGEAINAAREALAEMRAGDTGLPARDFLSELRARHKLLAD